VIGQFLTAFGLLKYNNTRMWPYTAYAKHDPRESV